MKEEEYRDINSFDLWLVGLITTALFVVMHSVNQVTI